MGCQVDVNSSFLQAITIMEVPVVKIKEGQPGTEACEKLIKSIVNMVCLVTRNLCMLESTGGFAAWCLRGVWCGTVLFISNSHTGGLD